MYRYTVNNSAPRPESYLTGNLETFHFQDLSHFITIDYTTANGPNVVPALTETQKAALYAELASGAETGWDYTMRWFREGNLSAGLLALNVRNTIAVDLNSILCACTLRYTYMLY
jgi:alpha,alpha-trehalase